MSQTGHDGQDRNPVHPSTPDAGATPLLDALRDHGEEHARWLLLRRPGSRVAGTGWRATATPAAKAGRDDLELERILVELGVAAQHLTTAAALRAYATSKRRRTESPPAAAFLDGLLAGLPRTADGPQPSLH